MHVSMIDLSPLAKDHLVSRARIRLAIDEDIDGDSRARAMEVVGELNPDTATAQEIERAAEVLERGGDPTDVVAPECIARAFAVRLNEARERMWADISSDKLWKVAEAVGLSPELAFVATALSTLEYVFSASDGLDMRCGDIHEDFDAIMEALHDADEVGPFEDWALPE